MASDYLHRRNSQRKRRSLSRSQNIRASYDVVLIVCEGEKTEPNYLSALRDELQLSSANIKVLGIGADPLTIVNHAIEEFECYKDYDQVYCVFDKDQHATYQAALDKIAAYRNRKENQIPIHAITSVPCFEYWLLLHFIESTKPYEQVGKKSAGDQVRADVKNHIPGYDKGHKEIYSITKDKTALAIKRAKRIFVQQENNDTDNPTTNFYLLVEYLINLKNKQCL